MTERTMAGKELSPYRSQCEFAKNIPEVDALFHSDDQAEYDLVYDWECYKDFGMQLFTGLYLELGEQEFRRGFKDLYVGLDTDSSRAKAWRRYAALPIRVVLVHQWMEDTRPPPFQRRKQHDRLLTPCSYSCSRFLHLKAPTLFQPSANRKRLDRSVR